MEMETQAIFEKGTLREIHECRGGIAAGEVRQFSDTGHITSTFFPQRGGKKHGEEVSLLRK